MHPDIFPSDLLGYAAAALVLLTFLAQSMHTLRAVAIASNVLFIAYALLADLPPVLLLHALLLPLNAWRLWQASRAVATARAIDRTEPSFTLRAPAMATFTAGAPLHRPAMPLGREALSAGSAGGAYLTAADDPRRPLRERRPSRHAAGR
jgi:hypothetical protein